MVISNATKRVTAKMIHSSKRWSTNKLKTKERHHGSLFIRQSIAAAISPQCKVDLILMRVYITRIYIFSHMKSSIQSVLLSLGLNHFRKNMFASVAAIGN